MQDFQERTSFLVACFETANEELLCRLKNRDDWIKLQLAAQVVILALANGVKLFGAEADSKIMWVSALAMPIALVFYLLYVVEDRLIKHLADYLGELSNFEAKLASATWCISNFNSSRHLRAFLSETLIYLPYRLPICGIHFHPRRGYSRSPLSQSAGDTTRLGFAEHRSNFWRYRFQCAGGYGTISPTNSRCNRAGLSVGPETLRVARIG